MASQPAIPHRSKSTTSVKERRKNPIPATSQDPDASRVHALIAAHRAMDRSKSRSSAGLDRADSNASRRTDASQRVQFSPATQLRRQRSVLQSKAPHLAAALQMPEEPRGISRYYDTDASEFGAMSESYGAEPSSYRRVRRTKSLLTPRRRLVSPNGTHTSLSQAPTLRPSASVSNMNTSSENEAGLGIRIRKSFNFLRPASRINVPRRAETSLGSHDGATALAQTQYFDCMPQPLPERKSSLILDKFRRPHKTFRKSVRSQAFTDPVGSHDSDTALINDVPPQRSVSGSLRNRLIKVFSKSMSQKPVLPPQQLHATRYHFGVSSDDHEQSATFDDYHVGDDDERRQSFYVPSNSAANSTEELDRFSPNMDPAGSRDSLHSNSRSRVTSWTNSTSTASSATRPGALQQNRLSIIKEDGGPHQPSSSAGRHIGGIRVFQDALPAEDEHGRPLPPVDSQRIYSALMKRIGEEEAEIEQTKAALEQIHHDLDHNRDERHDAGYSTIRAVSQTAQGSLQGNDLEETENIDPHDTRAMTQAQHKLNVERRREHLVEQQQQQGFFPFSSQYKKQTASPFRRLLDDRKSQDRLRSTDEAEEAATVTVADTGRGYLPPRHAALSSESIYSTTTNGGVNESYIPAMASIDDLPYTGTGMATIISVPQEESPEPIKMPSTSDSSERELKGWIYGQVDHLSRSDSKTSKHFREHAQIGPDDVELGFDETIRPTSRSKPTKRFPLLDLREVPSHNTPAPQRSSSLTKSQSGLLKQQSFNDLLTDSEKYDENRKVSSGLRKISPGNIARMLKERKSQMFVAKADDTGKENKRTTTNDDSPPMSTPGRLGLQMRSGNGRLRKRASEVAFPSKDREGDANKKTSTPGRMRPTGNDEESPTDRVKLSLSARLSRPFNMDVPESNRPFDSMYLGKREAPQTAAGTRLSVAPNRSQRGPGGYGGLGANPFDGEQDTALPQMASSERSESGGTVRIGFSGLWSSKRIVSDFLKKRRVKASTSNDDDGKSEAEGSPAFV